MPRAQIRRRLIVTVLLSVVIGSLLLALPPLQGVATQIANVDAGWVVVAVVLELASCVAFVVIFRLFFDELPAGTARELAWAQQGSGALLPGGGVGAMAIGGWLAHQAGMSSRRIIERSSALFFLTSATNVAALLGAGALLAAGAAAGPHDLLRTGAPIIGGLAVTAGVLLATGLIRRSPRRQEPGWLIEVAAGVDGALHSLRRGGWRLFGGLGYLAFDIAALDATLAAAGHPLPVAALVIAYLIGYLANLIPIPGGFGVLEGGLAGALIAYGAPATQATAAVVLYHAIAFWIPSLGGLLGYKLLRSRLGGAAATRQPRRVYRQPANPAPELSAI